MLCPMGNEYCQSVNCNHWALRGWCLLSHTSRAVDPEKEAFKLQIISLEKETLALQDTIVSLKKMLLDAQNIIADYRKPK